MRMLIDAEFARAGNWAKLRVGPLVPQPGRRIITDGPFRRRSLWQGGRNETIIAPADPVALGACADDDVIRPSRRRAALGANNQPGLWLFPWLVRKGVIGRPDRGGDQHAENAKRAAHQVSTFLRA